MLVFFFVDLYEYIVYVYDDLYCLVGCLCFYLLFGKVCLVYVDGLFVKMLCML